MLGPDQALRDVRVSGNGYIRKKEVFSSLKMDLSREILESKQIDPRIISSVLSRAKLGVSEKEIRSSTGRDDSSLVEQLITLGLLQPENMPRLSGESQTLFTTEKGFRFLRNYQSLVQLGGNLF
jgi:hypothetical protein